LKPVLRKAEGEGEGATISLGFASRMFLPMDWLVELDVGRQVGNTIS
jgi:hypothetical protein